MNWIDLNNPEPKQTAAIYTPIDWSTSRQEILPAPTDQPPTDIFTALKNRRSALHFNPVNEQQLSNFLWHSCRCLNTTNSPYGFQLEQRPSPSAGAIHPIHLALKHPYNSSWWRYDPYNHALQQIPDGQDKLLELSHQRKQLNDSEQATEVLLLAEPGKMQAKYNHANSLVWRDAGALIGIMSLVAESLNMSFCPLGMTGEPWAGDIVNQGELHGVGMILVGSK